MSNSSIIDVKAKLLSSQSDREITPEQYLAIEHKADIQAEGYELYAKNKGHNEKIIAKNKAAIKENTIKSYGKSGTLDVIVKEYNDTLRNPKRRAKSVKEVCQKLHNRDKNLTLLSNNNVNEY